MLILTDQNYKESISKGKVVIDFWAPWCGPCRMISPILEELAAETTDVVFAKVNVDDYPDIAAQHGIMSIPTLLFVKDGEVKDTSIGLIPKNIIQNKISGL
ncbi:MAG: thioredoxin [Candidatus Cloacimonetes bacterium]|nr:thioredoxin [Candidatus Cloacimonadota bacterium]